VLIIRLGEARLAPGDPEAHDLFVARQGGYWHHRIPGLCVTPQGALLAYCEARRGDGNDWANSDILLRRSDDGGHTWGAAQRLASWREHGPGPCNNPVCLADRQAGRVHLLYCHSYGRVYQRISQDDGHTWGAPVEITAALEPLRAQYDWGVVAVGPGHGIQLTSGRLLAPIWVSLSHTQAHQPSRTATIYSDDHGQSWQVGRLVADTIPNCNEATVVELADGGLLLNMRHLSERRQRAVALSDDGGEHWSPPGFDEALYEPRCFASMVRHSLPTDDRPGCLLFVSPDASALGQEAHSRSNLTLRASYDEGSTWPVACTLDRGLAGYADLAVQRVDAVLCLYERGLAPDERFTMAALTLLHVPLGWLEASSCA